MLKVIEFIECLAQELKVKKESNVIKNYFIEVRINSLVNIFVVSDEIKSIDSLKLSSFDLSYFINKKIKFNFLSVSDANDEMYIDKFSGDHFQWD
ncbi:hypothetical protein ACSZNM_17120 [Aeromonas hydrophila]